MMAHEPHLLDFSLPSNPGAMAVEPPPPFAHGHAGLLALQEGGVDMRALARQDLTNAMPWSRPPSSLYNTATGSLAAPPVLPSPASNMYALQLRSSRYLAPVKELLSEFCSLGGDLNATKRAPRTGKWEDMEASSTSTAAWANPSLLTAMDVLELERRKARLISMVEEVDRRYQRYREQMRAIEMSFEAVAGPGSAQIYMELAMRAMSRHFRCLRDGIVSQIRVTRKVMGEKDSGRVTPGATKGETPRLRAIDQCLRQQRAFQQSSALESYSWRPQRGLPERAVSVLRAWLFEHFLHPYPNDVDKHILARQTGLTRSQVSNWFINARVRLWKPMIEDMYMEETKQQEAAGQAGQPSHANQNSMINSSNLVNKKPVMTSTTVDGENLLPANSSSLVSSMLVDGPQFYGYSGLHSGGGGPVSLTLGLQQHPFAPSTMQQPSLMLDVGEEETVLPFRDLMGSQFLHD